MTESSVVDTSAEEPRFREAFNGLLGEIRAVPADKLLTVNVEPRLAITTVLKALPAIRAMRPRLVAEFAKFDAQTFDKLEDYTMAFGHAHTVYQAAVPEASDFDSLVEECIKQRDIVYADINAAVVRGLINGSRLKELKGNVGYRNITNDLFVLAQIAHTNLPKLEGKTFITPTNLKHIEKLAERLTAAIAEREREPDTLNEPAQDRQRAFTLFANTYTKARRAIGYLREEDGEDDLDEIVPSIYVGRASGKKRSDQETPKAVPAVPPVPAADTPPLRAASSTGRIGMPDSDPLTPQ